MYRIFQDIHILANTWNVISVNVEEIWRYEDLSPHPREQKNTRLHQLAANKELSLPPKTLHYDQPVPIHLHKAEMDADLTKDSELRKSPFMKPEKSDLVLIS